MADSEQPTSATPMLIPTTDPEVVYSPTVIVDETKKNESKFKMPFKVKAPQIKALQPPDRTQPPSLVLDPNIYSTKKTVMTILCLIIIIMANSIQLKFVIRNQGTLFNQFYSAQVGLGVTSVLLAAFIGFCLLYCARLNYNDQYKQRKIDFVTNAVMLLLFLLCIINIFIVAMN